MWSGALGSPSVQPDAVAGATRVVGTTAALATDNVLGAIGSATGLSQRADIDAEHSILRRAGADAGDCRRYA